MIKLLMHSADRRDALTAARRSGVRPSQMVWCQDPAGIRGLSLSHLKDMRESYFSQNGSCDSKLCDETKARLRKLGWGM